MAKQMVIIEIGYLSFLLPDDTGAATVVKTLSRGVPARMFGSGEVRLDDQERQRAITLTYVPLGTKVCDSNGSQVSRKASQPNHAARKLKGQHAPELTWRDDHRLL